MIKINLKDVVDTQFGKGIVVGVNENNDLYTVEMGNETEITMQRKYIHKVIEKEADTNYIVIKEK